MTFDSFDRLDERFGLRSKFRIPTYLDELLAKEGNQFAVIDAGFTVAGDWVVDWPELAVFMEREAHDVQGLFVLGDVVVEGSLMNRCLHGGPILYISGNLDAHNLLSGGAEISIGGSARIRDVVSGIYSHGRLAVWGVLSARLLVVDDHMFDYGKLDVCHVLNNVRIDFESEEGEAALAAFNALLIRPVEEHPSEVFTRVEQGEAVLNPNLEHSQTPWSVRSR